MHHYSPKVSSWEHKEKKRIDFIIDCCAEAAVEVSRKDIDRVINTNLVGTINILKKVKKDNSKIIFLSTSRVHSIETISKIFRKHNFNTTHRRSN